MAKRPELTDAQKDKLQTAGAAAVIAVKKAFPQMMINSIAIETWWSGDLIVRFSLPEVSSAMKEYELLAATEAAAKKAEQEAVEQAPIIEA